MTKNFLIDYMVYMRKLASEHRQLQHTDEEKHFFFGELPDFWENLRSEVHFPALVAEGCENEYTGSRSNLSKKRTTSFSIVEGYDQIGDIIEMTEKVSVCEKIAEEVLSRMMTDTDKPFRTVEVESISGEYNANTQQKYVGYRINLTLVDAGICATNPNAWIDPEPEPTPDPEPEPEYNNQEDTNAED